MTKWKTIATLALVSAASLGAAGISSAQMGPGADDMRPTFTDLDANGDGSVTSAEIEAFAVARYAAQDTNSDGALDADELVAAMTARAQARAAEHIARMITWADRDGDGKLSAAEMPGQNMAMMLSHMDENGDGQISAEEFEAGQKMRGGHKGMGKRGEGGHERGGHGGGMPGFGGRHGG